MKNKILFFGTPLFAAEILAYLLQHRIPIIGIVTQPDRPKGRSLEMSASSVKETILHLSPDTPIFQPEKSSDPSFLDTISQLKADLYVVVAFGQILPQKLLDIPRLGCINVHASLLPKYRGAAPIHRALLNGDKTSGIAIQKMVKQLDAGDVIASKETVIPPDMTFGELQQALCQLAQPLLLSVLERYEHGIPPATPQDLAAVTYAPKVEVSEGKIDWNRPALSLHNLIRSFSPRPGAWCWADKKRLKIFRTRLSSGVEKPGTLSRNGLVACGEGMLELVEVQPEGKRLMGAGEWLRGLPKLPVLN